MTRLRFTKIREVKTPTRGNEGDAGIDFYIPSNLTIEDFRMANDKVKAITIDLTDSVVPYEERAVLLGTNLNLKGHITSIYLKPFSRVIIPSGIRLLIEPKESMLMAANKSGISTKYGLLYTAEIVDSPYTGELHIGLINPTSTTVEIELTKAALQFIHMPILPTKLEEISKDEYNSEASEWGTRGSGWQGSTDNKNA